MGPKKGKGAPKECGEEEPRTCCGCRFPLLLALLQLALGIAVTVVGFLMASISPSLLVRDTPFWAGIIVCLVAYLGLFMLCVSYQVDEQTCIQFAMKMIRGTAEAKDQLHRGPQSHLNICSYCTFC
ncbi:PREDICTED: sarcospan isoform X2 [Miniopterus natalensis]|uniref:sarcospan isoform X2 n=1 Tax=Miniopterus natalensis TaxID=291302 RepID=UPI0007A6D769|nr:PREDICTED: sarcospan isoform X2 [Miniopterus natalensis]